MRSLRPRKEPNWWGLIRKNCFSESMFDSLMTKELYHLPPMEAALPVSKDAPDEEMMAVQVPLGQEGTHLRSMHVKGWANRPH